MKITSSPWGKPQTQQKLAEGIYLVSTAGHGGIFVSRERFKEMPDSVTINPYSQGTWFEEDLEAVIPMLFFFDEMPERIKNYGFDNLLKDLSTFDTYKSAYDYFKTLSSQECVRA